MRLALALGAGLLPFVALGSMPSLDDFRYWFASPIKYGGVGGLAMFSAALAAGIWLVFNPERAARVAARADAALFPDGREISSALLAALVAGAMLWFIPLRYDIAGDNISVVKWVIHPQAQGEARGIPTSAVFNWLLRSSLSDYEQIISSWRSLARACFFPFIFLIHIACRQIGAGRLLAFVLIATSASVLYNFLGHVDYYCVQLLFAAATMLVILLVVRGRWPVWALVPALAAGGIIYLPIAAAWGPAALYAAAWRFRDRLGAARYRQLLAAALALGAAAIVIKYEPHPGGFLPITGTQSVLSAQKGWFYSNNLLYHLPILLPVLVAAAVPLWRAVQGLWKEPFARPVTTVALLGVLPGALINLVMDYYHEWFDLDNMAIYMTVPCLVLLAMLAAPDENREADARPADGFRAGLVLCQVVFSALFIHFFNQPACLRAWTAYTERVWANKDGSWHVGNRVPVLLALGEYPAAGDWLARIATQRFPIGLLNWQDAVMDFHRKTQQRKERPEAYAKITGNPWFTLTHLQPSFYNNDPRWMEQRRNMLRALLASPTPLPPAADVAAHAFDLFDSHLMAGNGGSPAQNLALAQSLAAYFSQSTGSWARAESALVRDPAGARLILDVAAFGAGTSADARFQIIYSHSGANYLTASNLTANTGR